MIARRLSSDHIYDWSARSIGQDLIGFAQASPSHTARSAATGCYLAGLADRALQALRQAWMQMRGRPRPRPQVLPVSEFSRRTATDGLRSAGGSSSHPRAGEQLPAGACSTRRNLSDQPRTVAAPRGAVRTGSERDIRVAHCLDRYRRRGAAPGQHDRSVAGRGGER